MPSISHDGSGGGGYKRSRAERSAAQSAARRASARPKPPRGSKRTPEAPKGSGLKTVHDALKGTPPKPKPRGTAGSGNKAYTVKPGDTLSAIAKKNGLSLGKLLSLNPRFKTVARYQGGNRIFRGTRVKLR